MCVRGGVGEPTIATVCVEANFLCFPPWVLETKFRSFDLVVNTFLCTATLLLFLKYFLRCVMVTWYYMHSLHYLFRAQLSYIMYICNVMQ